MQTLGRNPDRFKPVALDRPVNHQPIPMKIERLETRISPASITFNDLDGDLVTITTVSKPADRRESDSLINIRNVRRIRSLSGKSR